MVQTIIPSTPQVSKHKQTNPTWRPPLSPSEKNIINHNLVTHSTSRKTQIRDISSGYNNSSSSSSSSSSCSLTKQSQSANRTHMQTTSNTTIRSVCVSFQGKSFSFQSKKQESVSQSRPKKLKNPSKAHGSNLLSKRLECSVQKKITIHDDLYLASDTDSSSSGSRESRDTHLSGLLNREIKTPKKNLDSLNHDAQLLSPRIGSCIRVLDDSMMKGRIVNMNSVINYGKIKKGESRIKEAHLMRLYHNRYLQWRYVNAKAESANLKLEKYAVNNLYNALTQTLELREYVTNKRIKLHVLQQNLKLISLLQWQTDYLEEWSISDRDEHDYLSNLSKALKASILCLPVVNGAMINIADVKNAIGSAVGVMQATGASVCSLLSQMESTNILVSELAKAVAHELVLLEQSKDLLSTVAAMHVKRCSLSAQIIQLNQNANANLNCSCEL